jgi:shikimate dehydrogenase
MHLMSDADNYAVFGNPISHSKSPQIHKLFAAQTNQHIHYQSILVETGNFAEALTQFQNLGGKGLNVTVPFKGDACAAVKHLTKRAQIAASVNTIWYDELGESHGDTTDGIGLVNDLLVNNISLRNKHILILGAGGAVCGVLEGLFEQSVASIVLANRTFSKAQGLVEKFSAFGEISASEYKALEGKVFDIIINGTSASLYDELPPLPNSLAINTCCYDMAYADEDTKFVKWAQNNGASKALDGFGMLVRQAAASFSIWRNVSPDADSVIEALRV